MACLLLDNVWSIQTEFLPNYFLGAGLAVEGLAAGATGLAG